MSLFQCENCGCVDNTSGSARPWQSKLFDWTGVEELEGKLLCHVCAPTKYRSGKPTNYGLWHDRFPRTFLPMGQFQTNSVGNLEHIETGSDNYHQYAIKPTSD